MSEAQVEQLVKMADQIARNMAAEGDAAVVKTAEHIRKFWTPAMRELLLAHSREQGETLPAPLPEVVEVLAQG